MWNKLTDKEREKFRYFIHRQNVRDLVALLFVAVLLIYPITLIHKICQEFGINSMLKYSELIVTGVYVLFILWLVNVFSGTTHGIHVRLLLLCKRSKYCYATMVGKVIYTGVHNRSFYNLQRYSFKRDIDGKVFRRKHIYFVDTKCDPKSAHLIILKSRRGFLYYGVCI